MENLTLRFKDAIWNKAEVQNIGIGGVGGIGSWVTLFLSRLDKHNLNVYDFDIIEDHNLGGQLFSQYQIGSKKTNSIVELVDYLAGNSKNIKEYSKYGDSSHVYPITFSCFDNMAARKLMFDKWKLAVNSESKENKKKFLFIDGRLEAEQYQVYVVTSDRIADYEKTLFSDDELPDNGVCSYKQTSHFAAMIASKMVQCFTNFLANTVEEDTYELPFFIQEEGTSFLSEIKD